MYEDKSENLIIHNNRDSKQRFYFEHFDFDLIGSRILTRVWNVIACFLDNNIFNELIILRINDQLCYIDGKFIGHIAMKRTIRLFYKKANQIRLRDFISHSIDKDFENFGHLKVGIDYF